MTHKIAVGTALTGLALMVGVGLAALQETAGVRPTLIVVGFVAFIGGCVLASATSTTEGRPGHDDGR